MLGSETSARDIGLYVYADGHLPSYQKEDRPLRQRFAGADFLPLRVDAEWKAGQWPKVACRVTWRMTDFHGLPGPYLRGLYS